MVIGSISRGVPDFAASSLNWGRRTASCALRTRRLTGRRPVTAFGAMRSAVTAWSLKEGRISSSGMLSRKGSGAKGAILPEVWQEEIEDVYRTTKQEEELAA